MKKIKLAILSTIILFLVGCGAGTKTHQTNDRSIASLKTKEMYYQLYSSQQLIELSALKILPNDLPSGFVIGLNPNLPENWTAPKDVLQSSFNDGDALSTKYDLLPKVNTQYKKAAAYLCTKYGLKVKLQCFISDNNFFSVDLQPNVTVEASVVMKAILVNEKRLVSNVNHNWKCKASFFPNDKWFTSETYEWWPYFAGIDKIWDIETGKNSITIAILDTGVRRTHNDLNDGRVMTYPTGTNADIIDNDNDPNDLDNYAGGHGTGCAGLAGAIANNNYLGAGIAHNVNIMPIRVLGKNGIGGSDQITAGIVLATKLNANIISMSLGGGGIPQMEAACNSAWNSGKLVLAAGGNEYYNNDPYSPDYGKYYNPVEYPAGFKTSVMGVGAAWPYNWNDQNTNQDWKRCEFSNDHDYIEIATAGTGIHVLGNSSDDAFTPNVSGTSQACPIVAGVAALIWSFKPDFTNQQLRDIIRTKSSPLTGFSEAPTTGRLDGVKIAEFMSTLISFPDIFFSTPEVNTIVSNGKAFSVSLLNSDPLSKVDYYLDGKYIESLKTAPFNAVIGTNKIGNRRATVEAWCYIDGLSEPKIFTTSIDIVNLFGDTNTDNVVDNKDVDLVITNFGKEMGDPNYRGYIDVNLDKLIDERDITLIGQYYGREL